MAVAQAPFPLQKGKWGETANGSACLCVTPGRAGLPPPVILLLLFLNMNFEQLSTGIVSWEMKAPPPHAVSGPCPGSGDTQELRFGGAQHHHLTLPMLH